MCLLKYNSKIIISKLQYIIKSDKQINMFKNILKDSFIVATILFSLFVIFEIFCFYKITKSQNHARVKEEYIPLLKYSKIGEENLANHFQNINLLGIKNNGIREYHPSLIYLYKPNLKSQTFYTNSFGLLDDEPNLSKKQILILGSSVVGSGLRQNFKENIDQYLEKQIDEIIGQNKYEVLNAGIGGYISNQEFNLMHLLSDKIDFDKVIYMSGANDIDARYRVKDFNELRSYDIIHSRVIKSQIEDNLILRKNPIISIYTYLKNYFLPSLNSYKYLGDLIHTKRVNKIKSITKDNLNKRDYDLINEIVQNYLANVRKMLFILKNNNIQLYVGIQPTLFSKNFKTIDEKKIYDVLINKYGFKYVLYYEEAYPMMKKGLELLKKDYPENITLLDTDIIFNETKIDIFRDNVHFLEYGNELVAKKIFKYLNFNKKE